MRWIFISVFALFLLVFGGLILLQSRWTKEQLSQILQEVALQAGVQLSIEKIEGELPLKWTLTNIHATLPEGDTIAIDKLRVRVALLPLLSGHFGVSYLHADHTTIAYTPSESDSVSSRKGIKGSFSLRLASFDEITILNRATNEQATYSCQARGKWLRGGRSFYLEGSIHSAALDLNLFCEGSKKLDHLQTALELTVRSPNAFAPFYTMPYEMAFELKSRSDGPWLTWKSLLTGKETVSRDPISGVVDVNVLSLALPNLQLEPQAVQLSSRFSLFADRSWDLSHLAILSPFIQLEGSAEFNIEGVPTQLHTSVSLPNLSHFSTYLKGKASGEIDLRDQRCHLVLRSPDFTMDQTTFQNGQIEVLAQVLGNQWTAATEMKADHPTLGYQARGEIIWEPKNIFQIKSFDLIANNGRLSGDVTIYDRNNISGGVSFQISDLSPLSELLAIDLAGQIGGQLQFEGENMTARALGKHLKVQQFLSNRVDLDLHYLKLSSPLQGKIIVTSDEAYFQDIYFTSFAFEMGSDTDEWDYNLKAQGDWKGPFDILTYGKLHFTTDYFNLLCNELSGKVLNKHVVLQKKCNFELSKDRIRVDALDLSIDEGHLNFSTLWDSSEGMVRMSAEHFPLDFLALYTPRFSLKGLSSIDVNFEGKKESLTGYLNVLLEHADITPAGSSKPIETKGSLQLNVADNKLQLHTHLVATDEQICEVSVTAPLQFELSPLKISIPSHLPISGQATIEGNTEQLFDFINLGSQRVGGFLSCHLLLSGTLNEPILHGPLSIQGGFYENYFIGIAVKDAFVTAEATGHDLVVKKAVTTDGEKGSSEATGIFHLQKSLPFAIEGTIKHFRVIRFDWLTGACSGPFTIDGNLDGALAKGKLELDEADVTVPDQLPSELPTLPITFINEPEAFYKKFQYGTPYPFRYDLDIHGDHDLRMSGRGIEAELEGEIHMTGQNLDVIATGALHTKKGKFSFAGKDFTINQGEILFSEQKSFLNITSTVEYPSLTVTVHFRGDLRSPQLIFESNPSMPTSSILARILFNKDVSELSAGQAIQLANTIVTLSGSSGPNVLESIRKNLGVDRLSVSVD